MLVCWINSERYILQCCHTSKLWPKCSEVSHKQGEDSLSPFFCEGVKLILFTHSAGFHTPHWNDRTSHRGRLQWLAVNTLVCMKIQIHGCHTRSWRVFTKLETTERRILINEMVHSLLNFSMLFPLPSPLM